MVTVVTKVEVFGVVPSVSIWKALFALVAVMAGVANQNPTPCPMLDEPLDPFTHKFPL